VTKLYFDIVDNGKAKKEKNSQKSAEAESGPIHTVTASKGRKRSEKSQSRTGRHNCCFSPFEISSYLYKKSVIEHGITQTTDLK